MPIKTPCFTICKACQGLGKQKRRIKKSVKLRYQSELEHFEKTNGEGTAPTRPMAHHYTCSDCSGSGLISADAFPAPDTENLPHVAIVGGGIGGVALAVACLHRGIPFTIYERDNSFNERSQGYGLTLQQASKVIDGFGISNLEQGVVSTRHLVHTTDGKVVAEWGMRKWMENSTKASPKKTNIHIARQSLRSAFIEQLGGNDKIKWGYQLIDFNENNDGKIDLNFQINNELKTEKADLIVGADGIRSAVRNILINDDHSPLRYLGCIVILGICSLNALENTDNFLLDSATVFQTANGNERIYIMPFDKDSIMWQLSFPMSEEDAKILSAKGSEALKAEAILRTNWHKPIPQILEATLANQVSGYPVYDRELLNPELMKTFGKATLIGDAAHPMSPFKGQGANQALLDALSLARSISKQCQPKSNWREKGLRESVLNPFESEMIERSSVKVEDSAAAAQFLHSDIALYEGNEPRGKVLKRKESLE
ncbi:FAD-dependent monooxygenase [Epilithonimonas xixisoli]|uniref:2-polyprenyl-6-methoxyphenol hydroxylase-like FAD-dependent oxidoreductase n=1 Tax=Epilithonimonas xixisoli TaxID=1476462 RepID=A0A4R8IH39_9FLAO|nr:NAD(P)/FAD-dependent oxidoreductase [Epilithonimonas xixisoli]TDX86153.1 2-polyprenyl-6-methoxyphenol hydroxylase-like FAD-dependent oxidoreductase [Epilithonimonas xixisoli]